MRLPRSPHTSLHLIVERTLITLAPRISTHPYNHTNKHLVFRSFLIEEKCRFLSNFSLKTAEVELPGEFLLPKHTHYHVRIARFMPRVEIVQKHNTSARRLYIRGHNGKIYPYLVVNDSGLGDARREERVLQLLRMLNHYLGKQKETSRRFLHFTVPRVVSVSPQMRLVEDNPASVSLLDIYRTECANRSVPLYCVLRGCDVVHNTVI